MKTIIAITALAVAVLVAPAASHATADACVPEGIVVTDVATGNQYVYDIQSPEVVNDAGDQYIDASQATTPWYQDSCGNPIPEICVEWRPGQFSALFDPADPVWRATCAEFAVVVDIADPPVAPIAAPPTPAPVASTVATVPAVAPAVMDLSWVHDFVALLGW